MYVFILSNPDYNGGDLFTQDTLALKGHGDNVDSHLVNSILTDLTFIMFTLSSVA